MRVERPARFLCLLLFVLAASAPAGLARAQQYANDQTVQAPAAPPYESQRACARVSSGMVSWWPGQDGLDIVGSNNGRLREGVALARGMVGQAFRFNGAGAYVQAADLGMPYGNAPRSVELWIKPEFNARFPFIYGEPAADNAFYPIVMDANVCIGQWGGGDLCGATNVVDGSWHHIAMTYDGESTATLYVDGNVEVVWPGKSYSTTPGGGKVFLASNFVYSGDPESFAGLVDEVSVYDRALLRGEIRAIHAARSAGKCVESSWPTKGSAWVYKADMPTPRNVLGIAAANGKIYAVGGWWGDAPGQGVTGKLEIYDTVTNTWATGASMPTARSGPAAAIVGGKLYAMGGWNGTEVTNEVEVYDLRSGIWSSGRPMILSRDGASAAVLDGKIFVVGGGGSDGNPVPTVEVHDPFHGTWTTTASHNWVPRWQLGTAVVDGKLYALGGSIPHVWWVYPFFNTVQSYDPRTDSWVDETPMPFAREAAAAVVGDTIYLVGGMNWWDMPWDGAFLGMVEAYQPASDRWSTRGPLNDGRNCLSAVAVNGNVYAIGGWDNDGPSGAVEMYAYPKAPIIRKGDGCTLWGGDLGSSVYTTSTVAMVPQALPGPVTVTCKATGVYNGTGKWLVLKSSEHPDYPCSTDTNWLPAIPHWVEYISPNGDATLVCWH